MGKFRKKPIVVEAEQWVSGRHIPGLKYPIGNPSYAYIETLEGRMIVRPGDWVVTGVKGEMYPVKPSIFEKTYEEVE